MGADQSRLEEFHDEQVEGEQFHDASGGLVTAKGPKLYAYQGVGREGRWNLVEKNAAWRLTSNAEDYEGDEDDYEDDGNKGFSWHLHVSSQVSAYVDDKLTVKFNDEQLRVDFLAAGHPWALKFLQATQYRAFCQRYQQCLFENMHQLAATIPNKEKVLGKDFMCWDTGEDEGEVSWEDASDSLPANRSARQSQEDDEEDSRVRETAAETTPGKFIPQALVMGALDNSFVLHSGGVDVYRNAAQGLHRQDVTLTLTPAKSGSRGGGKTGGGSYGSPLGKALLMRGETTMMLMGDSPGKAPSPLSSHQTFGLQQLDLGTGKTVAHWQFEKDGTPVSMRDVTGDSKGAQLDAAQSTFLGLDDNRLCRWDMREKHGMVQVVASTGRGGRRGTRSAAADAEEVGLESPSVLSWADGHQFSRGTNFRCFATTGDGCVAVGSSDGKVRLYSTTSMRQAKTCFPGLGSPITHIDVTYDGRWVLATTDRFLLLIGTSFRDAEGRDKSGFTARMGGNMAAPRLLKLHPVHAQQAEAAGAAGGLKFGRAQFSWVTESGRQERHIVAAVGQFSVIWNFRRVKQPDHACYRQQAEGVKSCFCYKIVPRDESVLDSKFMHDNFMSGAGGPEAPLVVATPHKITSFNV